MTKLKSLLIILPAYNEASMIGSVLKELNAHISTLDNVNASIIVVDDGSCDGTVEVVKSLKIKLLRHVINRGLGGALATGLEYAKRNNYDIALTMDSDGQHDIEDIIPGIKPILIDKADVVIGSRMLGQKGMPWDRVIINNISNIITWLLFKQWTTDSQSGFRVFNKKALQKIQLKTQGMEVSSEFFTEIKRHKLQFVEVPIKVKYTEYSRQKGQTNLNSVRIGWKLLLRLFR